MVARVPRGDREPKVPPQLSAHIVGQHVVQILERGAAQVAVLARERVERKLQRVTVQDQPEQCEYVVQAERRALVVRLFAHLLEGAVERGAERPRLPVLFCDR